MQKEYTIYEKDLKTALDHLDTFQTKMELFTESILDSHIKLM